MCNLYSMTRSREEVRSWFGIPDNRAARFEPKQAFFPGYDAPVVRLAEDGERELALMSWGFVLKQTGKAPRRVTNVRDDKILRSSFWSDSFEQRRCLVPASSYSEPNGNRADGERADWVWLSAGTSADPLERPLFAFPGIWRSYFGLIRKGGPDVVLETYAFMTCPPNALTASINHERMPVLLNSADACETWLRGTEDEAYGLARSFDPAAMRIVQSGREKKDLLVA